MQTEINPIEFKQEIQREFSELRQMLINLAESEGIQLTTGGVSE